MVLTCNKKRRGYVGKTVMVMDVPGKRRKGRPKRRWLDSIKHDFTEKNYRAKRQMEMTDRNTGPVIHRSQQGDTGSTLMARILHA